MVERLALDKRKREAQRRAFLDQAGWSTAIPKPLPSDASFRRYMRLSMGNQRVMLMDAAPEHGEDVRPFARIGRHLIELGLSAPEILAEDAEHGFLLLEDFGNDTFTHLLAQGISERSLYTLATDVLIALHAMEDILTAPDWLAPYDDERLLAEAALLPDWFMSAQGIDVTAAARADLGNAWLDVFRHVHAGPRTLVLRDFHVDNLMRLSDPDDPHGRQGVRACGLLDFQDALAGHPAYDLMSLLEDARRDVDQDLQADMKDRYFDALNIQDREAFETAYAILGAQRHAKVIGIFTRLDRRDQKPVYLKHIYRVWRLLEHSLTHPALSDVRAWIDEHIPYDVRRAPESTS
jgi:aminoglycoside/choline kinase family phosphotransferase